MTVQPEDVNKQPRLFLLCVPRQAWYYINLVQHNTRYRFVIQSLAIMIRSCGGLIWASAGPLLPLVMKQYGINRGAAGWFASAAPLTVAVSAVPLGIFMTRFSIKKRFAIGAFLQAAGIIAPLCSSYFPVLLTRVVFALGTAITVPVATAIAAEWFTARELPLLNGMTMSFVNLGNALAFVVTVPIAAALSWNAPMVIYGAITLTCATGWAILGRDKSPAVPANEPGSPLPEKSELTIRQALTQRSTLLLAFAVMGNWCLGNAMGSWLPTYYHEVFKMPLEKASSITAIVTAAGTVACILGGVISMRTGRRKPFIVIPGIFMGVSAISALLFNSPALIFLTVACFGVLSNVQTPTLFTIPMELKNASPRTGVLIINAMQTGGTIGAFAGPLIVGYLADVTGSYLPGFIICAVISLSLLVTGLLLPETGPKGKKS